MDSKTRIIYTRKLNTNFSLKFSGAYSDRQKPDGVWRTNRLKRYDKNNKDENNTSNVNNDKYLYLKFWQKTIISIFSLFNAMSVQYLPVITTPHSFLYQQIIIYWLPCVSGENIGVGSCCLLDGLDSRVVLLVDWLLPKAKEPAISYLFNP